ncbi:MAG: 30S ribosomal protein S11 [Bacteroidia bacterium]|nr:30S ribosomal protein S11 [Bacteroidia bacterium]
MAKSTKTKKKIKVEPEGMVHISTTFNNIIVTITDNAGNTISWSSAGKSGFKGSKKNTPYAGMTAATSCSKEAYELGLRKVSVFVKGTGAGRESAIRAVAAAGIEVTSIQDFTPIPHNGCRPPKRRRV